MILVFGGTTESHKVAESLLNDGSNVTISCTTQLGAKSVLSKMNNKNLKVINGQLDKQEIIDLLTKNNYLAVIDATHPFATQISLNSKEACEKTSTPYLRLVRAKAQHIDNELIIKAPNFKEAAKKATEIANMIFLTIGANNVGQFSDEAKNNNSTIIARVLNQESSVIKCLDTGVEQKNIISASGPFTTSQNIEHFSKFKADVVVSKDSGQAGGLSEKIDACTFLKIPLILIERPQQDKNAFYDVNKLVKQVKKFG